MTVAETTTPPEAEAAWQILWELMLKQRTRFAEAVAELDLTPVQATYHATRGDDSEVRVYENDRLLVVLKIKGRIGG